VFLREIVAGAPRGRLAAPTLRSVPRSRPRLPLGWAVFGVDRYLDMSRHGHLVERAAAFAVERVQCEGFQVRVTDCPGEDHRQDHAGGGA